MRPHYPDSKVLRVLPRLPAYTTSVRCARVRLCRPGRRLLQLAVRFPEARTESTARRPKTVPS